ILREIDSKNIQKDQDSEITKEYLITNCQTRFIGIQIEYLREVFDLKDDNALSPIPFTPSYILGIINVRGEIIPVLSLAEILGIEETEFNLLKLVVIEHHFKIAFPIKTIVDLKAVDVKNIRVIKDVATKAEEQFISDEFEYNETVVSILDVPKLFLSEYIL
ncbi:MAG: chemotaxis protein CheW, partial [Spirochaetales bacterium]|nr:chemotaxis protein CheW [Spirochaetales bacterium]